jgi:hypothetical protein
MFVNRLSKTTSAQLLAKGTTGKLDTYWGSASRFEEPRFAEREGLLKLKSRPGALGVFVLPTITQSQPEPEFRQVYLHNGPTPEIIGRTLALEVGHLLLREGHTGGQRLNGPCDTSAGAYKPRVAAPWTSGLVSAVCRLFLRRQRRRHHCRRRDHRWPYSCLA